MDATSHPDAPTFAAAAPSAVAAPARPILSIIVPAFNEEEGVAPFLRRTLPVLEGLAEPFEILFVDDGSTDATLSVLKAAAAADPRIGAISFSRNFGKEVAIAAGLDAARGEAVILMDADLQHPPEVLPEFVARWREGFEMVYGVRRDRASESAPKRWFAKRFYRSFERFADTPLPEGAGDFRLIGPRPLAALRALPERARFSKGLYAWVGFSAVGVPFDVAERAHGQSKFNFPKLLRFAFDGLTSFSVVPLRFWTYLGLLVSVGAILTALFYAARTLLFGTDVPGFPSLIVSVMFFSGVQLISLGVIGEYVGRIFAEVKRRPLYIVADRIGAASASPPSASSDRRV